MNETQALRRAVRLEWATIAWNVVEVGITISLGIAARSLALVAFGLDSVVEVFASLVVLWQLRGDRTSTSRVRLALRLVAAAFVALGLFLVVASGLRLLAGAEVDESPIGIAYLAATVVVMLLLARAKGSLGADLGNHPLAAEARMTLLDGFLAGLILTALLLNLLFGWWWADSLAAFFVGLLAFAEARENFEESSELSDLS
ncbi:MAG: cation transporter [Acidimicrobiales bacterium]